jgi:hypothetical protein
VLLYHIPQILKPATTPAKHVLKHLNALHAILMPKETSMRREIRAFAVRNIKITDIWGIAFPFLALAYS